MGIPLTAKLSPTQEHAIDGARGMNEMHSARGGGNTVLSVDDGNFDPGYVIYIYNLLGMEHIVEQPPTFPRLVIPACEPGEQFSVIEIPAFTKLPFERNGEVEGTTAISYRREDGRKAATSLLNPSALPSTRWDSQLGNTSKRADNFVDQSGNNLNALGVFWSLTKPDDEKLAGEIKLFKERVRKTAEAEIKEAEKLAVSEKTRAEISPRMHFFMDYLGKQANWHMSLKHMTSCPNCGETIAEGLAYHRNAFNERCIIDKERCIALGVIKRDEPVAEPEEEETVSAAVAPEAKTRRPKGAKQAPK
jgi:hypothetical protein